MLILKEKLFTEENMHYVRFQVLTAASMKFRIVFWDVLPCKINVAWKLDCVAVLCRRKRKYLRSHCKRKSNNSSSSGTEYGDTSECLHSGEWWALPAPIMNSITGFISL
jgi:hypothetical protein